VPPTLFGGVDDGGGIITNIRITTFPTNATSITINSITYTAATFPIGGVSVPTNTTGQPTQTITVDPIDGIGTVVISYVTVDNAGISSTTPGSVSIPFTSILPIKIVSFTAMPNAGNVDLQWVVSIQTNVLKYEVEFSKDGIHFDKIATNSSNGNAQSTYYAKHANPVVGINYYRIKTIENDGTISYSEIRKVNFGKLGSVLVYPNPVASGNVNITVTGSMVGKAATISIFSVDGKLIRVLKFEKINQTENVDISKLSNGSYILKITTLTEVVNVQLEKIN
jgi:hypothetical protein